jgi:hypothetical protein
MEIVMPKKNDRTPKHPAFLEAARAFYADAFEHRRTKDLAAAMEEWGEMEESEQSFAVAHLLYLNLQAQADALRVLVDVRDVLDEVADGVDQALEAAEEEPGEDDREDEAEVDEPGGFTVDHAQAAPANDGTTQPVEGA